MIASILLAKVSLNTYAKGRIIMGKSNDGIYSIVDEEFIKKFKLVHVDYMKNFYYGKYTEYCKKIQSLAVDRETFFTNMRRRKIKIVQTCCPYCGSMQVIITREKMDEIKNHKYCNHCGKSSVSYNIFCQLASFIRIREIHKMGLDIAIEKYKELILVRSRSRWFVETR